MIELENGFRIYDSGDTTAFGDMALIRELYKPRPRDRPDRRPLHDGSGRCGGRRRLLGVRDVLPVHWGTFPILAGTPAALVTELGARGIEANVVDWKPGESAD